MRAQPLSLGLLLGGVLVRQLAVETLDRINYTSGISVALVRVFLILSTPSLEVSTWTLKIPDAVLFLKISPADETLGWQDWAPWSDCHSSDGLRCVDLVRTLFSITLSHPLRDFYFLADYFASWHK